MDPEREEIPAEDAFCSLRFQGREIPLNRSQTFLGRGEECDVQLLDPLASRRHAVITLREGKLELEDLSSMNGTFLNQTRIQGRTGLLPGDCIFVGSSELRVVGPSRTDSSEWAPASSLVGDDEPSSAVHAISAAREAMPSSHTRRAPAVATDASFEHLLGLVETAFEERQLDTTATIFASHIKHVLDVAHRAEPVEARVVDTVGRYAVKLCRATREAHWLEKAIELHFLTCRPFAEGTLHEVLSLMDQGLTCEPGLLRDYIERLRSSSPSVPPEDRPLVESVLASMSRR